MGMSVGGGGKVKAEPNVVPMIDIMLVILIIFMLIIPQLLSGFTATPPKGINLKSKQEESHDLVLGLDMFGQYYLNKQPIEESRLADTLRYIFSLPEREDNKVVFLRADKDLEYGRVLDALDIVSKNGARVAGLISDQEAGTESSVAGDAPPPLITKSGGSP